MWSEDGDENKLQREKVMTLRYFRRKRHRLGASSQNGELEDCHKVADMRIISPAFYYIILYNNEINKKNLASLCSVNSYI